MLTRVTDSFRLLKFHWESRWKSHWTSRWKIKEASLTTRLYANSHWKSDRRVFLEPLSNAQTLTSESYKHDSGRTETNLTVQSNDRVTAARTRGEVLPRDSQVPPGTSDSTDPRGRRWSILKEPLEQVCFTRAACRCVSFLGRSRCVRKRETETGARCWSDFADDRQRLQ